MPTAITKLALALQFNLFRAVLTKYLSGHDNIDVAIHASNTMDLFMGLESSPVDILLLDISIITESSNDILEAIRVRYPDIKVLILSEHTDLQIVSDLLELGIYGYISKRDEPEELLRAIMAAADNRIYRNKLFTEALYWNRQKNTTTNANGPAITLSEREQRVLQMLWDEKSNREIAAQLFIGIRSIEKIRQDMKEKLGIKSTVGLLKYGIEKKIIEINNKDFLIV